LARAKIIKAWLGSFILSWELL